MFGLAGQRTHRAVRKRVKAMTAILKEIRLP
jgi:hypothetical protein